MTSMRMAPPQARRPVSYKQPRRVNAVSLTMAAIAGILGYIGYCVWPVLAVRAKVKNELEEVLPKLWRMNLRGSQVVARELPPLKKELLARLRAAGVRDPNLEVVLERQAKIVAAEARYTMTVSFDVIDKAHTFVLAPRAQTDASRVDW